MRVFAFSSSPYPNGFTPMSNRLHCYMKALQKAGHSVLVAVASSDKNPHSGVFEGIPYKSVYVLPDRKLWPFMHWASLESVFSSLADECDAIFTSEESIISVIRLSNVVHKKKKKIVLELNEYPYVYYSGRKLLDLKNPLMRFVFLRCSLPLVDGVIAISQPLYDLAKRYVNPKAKVIRIPILTDNNKIFLQKQETIPPYIFHAGALSDHKDGVKAMLKSFLVAYKALNGNLRFVFTSHITFKQLNKWIERFIIQNNLQGKVIFVGLVPREQLEELYAGCSLAIVNKPINKQNLYNFPTKLTELLPRRIPLILSKTGEINRFFIDGVHAYMVTPNNEDEISKAIIRIIQNPEEASSVAEKAYELSLSEFHYERYSEALSSFFLSVQLK